MNVAPRIQTYCCPSCGGFIGEAPRLEAVADTIKAPQKRALFNILASAPGKPVTVAAIERKLWEDDPAGGPENSRGAVYVQICKLNKIITQHGWFIAHHGRGEAGAYRLIPTEARQ